MKMQDHVTKLHGWNIHTHAPVGAHAHYGVPFKMLEEHWMIILTIFVTYKSTYLIEVEKVDEYVVKDAF